MADIRISGLPPEPTPSASDVLPIDGATTRKTTIQAAVEIGRPAASQAEAEAGTDPTKAMTPLTTAQAISAQALKPSAIGVSVQAHSANLDTLSGVTPGAAGLAILADALQADVRDYLDTAPYVETRTALKALDTTKDTISYLKEAGRQGIFKWTTGDFSAQIAADPNEGIYVKADAIAATSGAWVREGGWAVGGDAYVSWWTGVDDDDTVQAAIDAVPATARLVFEPGKTYSLATTISSDRSLRLCWAGAKFHKTTTGRLFSFVATYAEVKALSASYVKGALTIAVSAMSQALAPGEEFKIFSNVIDGADRDSGASASQYRQSEWAVAAEGTTTTSIVIAQPLRFVEGVSPSSGLTVDSYTTTDNARVFRLAQRSLRIECDFDTEIFYTDGMEAVPWTGEAIKISGYSRPVIDDVRITRGYGHGISLGGNYCPVVNRAIIMNLEDDTANSQFGYGIADASFGTIVNSLWGTNCRHVYTSSVAQCTAGDTNTERVLSAGRTVGATVNNGIAIGSGGTPVAPWDSHHSSEDLRFINCYVEGSADYGFNIRGRNIHLINPIVRNCEKGINVFTEFNGGDWLAIKSADYFTSATITAPDVECGTFPLNFAHCSVTTDITRLRSTGHVMVYSDGAAVKITGTGDCRTSTLLDSMAITEQTGLGILHALDAAASAGGAIAAPGIIIADNVDAYIDCTSATDALNDLRGFHADTNVFHQFRGRVNVRLSNDFSMLFSTTGTFSSTENSMPLIFAYAGAADNTLPLNIGTNKVKIQADDGTCWYDAAYNAIDSTEKFSSRNVDVNITHAGTGAMVENVFTPGMPQISKMDSAGHYFHLIVTATKAGSAGTATIRARLSSAFVADIPLLAADRAISITLKVYCQGDNDQRCVVSSQVNDGGGGVSVVRQWYTDETVDLAAATFGGTFGVQAAVGDSIKFEAYALKSTIAGFGF